MKQMKKLHWKCRRGMKELDILFEHYLYQHYQDANVTQQSAFETLVDMQDPLITDYLFERATPESDDIAAIIETMRHFNEQRNQQRLSQ